ncbi:NAD(P)-dependent oxidoreductase [Hornefia butyriciproducens]|uniref:Hydroxyacid dehydrogenase n=2 Tax=Hornefia porci TaxID=2652292 RepID=A0A1Q9JIG7_9FIRM|nr:NAD(P)-dependent oxidoreductase [Hornefia butyriciproducens]MCI7412574.1 hydroxyacid dehydrogenase [Clostridiales bacterium]MDY6211912.1 NAD(P)-dependent oxidoreductase [Hornefia butyriciproducens]OLR55931.1 hydroxyacid dehydrogenase [Hornefia porci]
MIKMALCTPLPGNVMDEIKKSCDVSICGELKHGKGNVTEEMTREECIGNEIIVLGDEIAGADTIHAWAEAGMRFIGVAKGTPVTVDFNAIQEAGLELSYTPGRNRVAVAEFTIGLMIAAARRIAAATVGLHQGEHLGEPMKDIYDVPEVKNVIWGPLDENHPFTDYGIGFEMYGKKLGIAGYGAIGREVAVRAEAFGMKILAYDPYLPADKIRADGAEPVDLDTMLTESDIISIHLPVLPSTKGIVNRDWFNKMKPTAYVVNTARAAVIDQRDFVEALQNGTIAGAAMDVYWKEPIPANHPFLKMRNVTLTPHMAGLTTDVDNWSGTMMGDEVLAYLNKEPRKYLWKIKK